MKKNTFKNVLDVEKQVGIEVFLTKNEGIGGKIRFYPEDFVVEEISKFPIENNNGKFCIVEVSAVNWETNHLVKEISNSLHISRKRISFGGTKDKRSKSKRLMSFYNVNKEDIDKISIKDVDIKFLFKSDKPLKIGDLIGNKFNINIRKIENNIENIDNNFKSIESIGGFPNFYGIQRFGTVRPITHIVGKYLVLGDFEKAVMTYIANPIKGEDELSYSLRSDLEKTHDFSEALKSYPIHLNFEKSILNKLVLDSKDFVGAIMELPKNLLTMFIYAYQSYLFNKILSRRILNDMPINRAVVGDILYPIKNNNIELREIPVSDFNLNKVNEEIDKGKAIVTGQLFGSNSEYSDGEIGEIEKAIIDEENINLKDFIIPEIPFISSKGSRRALFSIINNLVFNIKKEDDIYLNVKFELSKGCYATSFLREIMKSDDIKNY